MATNNATNTSNPVSIAQGGSNASSMATSDGVIYYDGTRLVTSSAGTSGQVFTSNGTGVAPTYQAATSGNLIFLSSQTASNSTHINFTSGITTTYNTYFLIFSNVVPATSTAVLNFNITANGTFTDITSNFLSGFWSIPNASTTITNANSTSTMILSGPLSTTAGLGAAGFLTCFNSTSGTLFAMSGNGVFNGSTSGAGTYAWYAVNNTSSGNVLDGFQFIMSTGNISTGTFSLYGVLE